MNAYYPACVPCRNQDAGFFYTRCPGCQARLARIAAEHKAVTDAQVESADSTMQELETK